MRVSVILKRHLSCLLASGHAGFERCTDSFSSALLLMAVTLSVLEALAFAPFASMMRKLGPRTAHQAKLLTNHEAASAVSSSPNMVFDWVAGRVKRQVGESLSALTEGALGLLQPYVRAAQWLADGEISAQAIWTLWVTPQP